MTLHAQFIRTIHSALLTGAALPLLVSCDANQSISAPHSNDATFIPLDERPVELEEPADTRDARRRQHVRTLENIHRVDWDEFVQTHFADSFRKSLTADELEKLRERLVVGTSSVGSAMLLIEGDTFILDLGGSEGETDIRFTVDHEPPYGITDLKVGGRLASEILPTVTRENIKAVLDLAAEEGFDGVVHVRKDGETLVHRALGYLNGESGPKTEIDTVYDIGSQPIEFTVALAYIAAADGALDLDDPVSAYLGRMPENKRGMTVRHLLESRSGIPDFLDTAADADPDLDYISRAEFIKRVKRVPTSFAPGQREEHSHAAFTLLAAIIEISTGQSYFDYLNEKILKPAGMNSTGMYGTRGGIPTKRFAIGAGPLSVGTPNIPPNWGPASWFVIGSGGMYSTLDDMLRFKNFMLSDSSVPVAARKWFAAPSFNTDGSHRGFERFEFRHGFDVVLILTNSRGGDPVYRALTKRLGEFVQS